MAEVTAAGSGGVAPRLREALFELDGVEPEGPGLIVGRLGVLADRVAVSGGWSEAMLDLALRGSGLGLWFCDPLSSWAHFTPGFKSLLGDDGEGFNDSIEDLFARVHRDEVGLLRRALIDHADRGIPVEVACRIRSSSGEFLRVLVRGDSVRDDAGRPGLLAGSIIDVAGQRRGEQDLRGSGEFAGALLDSLLTQVAVIDGSGRILAVNKAWRDFADSLAPGSGAAEGADYLGAWDRAQGLAHEDADAFAAGIRDILDGRCSLFAREYRLELPDGPRWFLGRVTRFAGEGPPRAVVTHNDITDRQRAERAVSDLNERLTRRLELTAALRRIDTSIAAGRGLGETLQRVVAEARMRLGVEAAVLLLDTSTGLLECACSAGLRGESLRRPRSPLVPSPAGRAMRTRRPVSIEPLTATYNRIPRLREAVEEGFTSYRVLPILARGEAIGALELFGREPIPVGRDSDEFLEALADQAAFAVQSARLLDGFRRTNRGLGEAFDATIEGWSRALEMRDKETEGHSRRVTAITLRLARELGVPEGQIEHVRRGALLHDIGKMGIPDSILLKPGPLGAEEWAIMEMHPTFALQMLWPIEFLRPALDIPYAHHERWDGSGYPQGLKGEEIPLPARIFAVADVWDTLTHERPYRPAWPRGRVRDHLLALAGTHLDPAVVEAFLRSLDAAGPSAASPPAEGGPAECERAPVGLPDRAAASGRPVPAGAGPAASAAHPLKILVAGRGPAGAAHLPGILREAGHEVIAAEDGLEAFRIVERGDVSLVLTQWTMPGLDGRDLCRRIRGLEGQPYTYVILLADGASPPERLEGLRAGADDFLADPADPHELMARVEVARRVLDMHRAILDRTERAERLAAELQAQNKRLAELAWTDSLTGLCNRRRLLESLEAGLSLASRRDLPLSVAMLDVDRFKHYNDAHGHQAGDDVLRLTADLLRDNVRAHDLVARYGGEEFLILLPDTDPLASRALAERLRAAIEAHPWPLRPVTASVGVATCVSAPRDAGLLVERADQALYRSKRSGRNRVTHFDDKPRSASWPMPL